MTISELQRLRQQKFFAGWADFVTPERVDAAEASIRTLIDDLIALGPQPDEKAARQTVEACVLRFNDLDDGWICTLEREDIGEQIAQMVEACGFEYEEDWLDQREW